MTPNEVAKKLNVCAATVRRLIKEGRLHAILITKGEKKSGNRWYITDEWLAEYLEKCNDN